MRRLEVGFVLVMMVILGQVSATWADTTQVKCPVLDVTGLPAITAYVHVLNENGDGVAGLNRANFQLYEDSEPVSDFTVTATAQGSEFLTALLLMDTSGSMEGEPWKRVQEAAKDFLSRLSRSDKVALIAFSQEVKPLVPFTPQVSQLETTLASLQPRGGTALHDGLLAAIGQYKGIAASRRAIILLTDGEDTSSKSKLEDVLPQAKAAGIPIYAIGLGSKVNVQILNQYRDASNGSLFLAGTPDELLGIYRQIAGRLQTEYRLEYRTSAPDEGAWHNLRVVARYDSQEAEVTRQYLADKNPMIRGIKPHRSLLQRDWFLLTVCGAVGLLLASLLAALFQVLGIGQVRHRVMIVCIGIVVGIGFGLICWIWLL